MAHISYICNHLIPELWEVLHLAMTSEDAVSNWEIIQQRAWINHVMAHTGV